MNKEPQFQNNLEEGNDSNESGSDKGILRQDLTPDATEEEAGFGEQEFFNLSHWGCLGHLVLLGVVIVTMAVRLIKPVLQPGDDLASPVLIWIIAMILMISIMASLG